MNTRKKLIEVALPLEKINEASAREKSIRHGHPSTLHLWWARRPLAAARAVIFAQMVDDPSAHPELFPTEEAQEVERQRLFRLIEQLVQWENTTNEDLLQQARDEIWKSWRRTCAENKDHPRAAELFNPDKLPAFHDPFAGGGALPLEAQRLGLEAYASDLNPVAVLINKAMIEIPPKFAGMPPVNPAANPGARAARAHKGWHSRGYLPHLDQPGLIQSITYRLADAMPATRRAEWEAILQLIDDSTRRTQLERYLDAGHGSCLLRDERVAQIVEENLLHFDAERYRLIDWVVMPNHVHVLIEPYAGVTLSEIVHSWKSYTAKAINKLLGRTGELWQPEYFDRYIRDDAHLSAARQYIQENPVRAGLVQRAEQWKHSSAAMAGEVIAGEPPALPGMERQWRGAQGLAEDVRYYGKWMRDEAEKRIGHLYPKIEITAEMVRERPDLKQYVGQKLTVIAWLWARTVKSPNPAFRHVDVPLASTFMLSTKAGKEAYVEPILTPSPRVGEGAGGEGAYRFTVRTGKPKDAEAAKNGTKLARGANFACLMSGTPIDGDYIKAEGQAGRMGARLMAVVAEGERGRVYLAPTPEHEAIAQQAQPEWAPDVAMPDNPRWFSPPLYGLKTFGDLFTDRQLVALNTFADLVQEVRELVSREAIAVGMNTDERGLSYGGIGAKAYADAVGVYLAFAIDRMVMTGNSLVRWNSVGEKAQHCFGRQALPMLWDFAEPNFFATATGSIDAAVFYSYDPLNWMTKAAFGESTQEDAATQSVTTSKIVSTDPPYYDNIAYADLSDFFYVWLRRTSRSIFPHLFATMAVPKAEELVATPYRHGSKEQAEQFFLNGMTQAMSRLCKQAHPAFPVTIYYAFKQSETSSSSGTVSTGWETFIDAVIDAGFSVNGTWPVRTEMRTRQVAMDANALASSIVLVCRPRPQNAPTVTRRDFVAALKAELPVALKAMQRGNIAPVDLAQASIGPGMAVYTRYGKVIDASGKPLSVREALALINATLDEVLAEQEGDFDADTRWALAWFEQYGFDAGEYGVAETLSKAKNTSVGGMVSAGLIASGAGKVRLLRPDELPTQWDPTADSRLTVWEMTHHLVRVLEQGEQRAAELLALLGAQADIARELAYRLYAICERKKRAAEALAYNSLVQSWPEMARLSQEQRGGAPVQQGMEL